MNYKEQVNKFCKSVGTEFFTKETTGCPDNCSVRYLGTNTLVFSDGKTDFMVDAYVSRRLYVIKPKITKTLLPRIASEAEEVGKIYNYIKKPKISHIFITHNHYDHMLDIKSFSAEIEKAHGKEPVVVGSYSFKNCALALGIKKENIVPVRHMVTSFPQFNVGDFKIMLLPGNHLKLVYFYRSSYNRTPPKDTGKILNFKEGGVFDLLIKHKDMGTVLLTSSFAYGHYNLTENVDTLILSIGGSGRAGEKRLMDYNNNTIAKFKPKRVYFSHYDNFTRPLGESIKFLRCGPEVLKFFKEQNPETEIKFLKHFTKVIL